MNDETLLIQIDEECGEVLDSYASATDQTPDEAMQLLIQDGLERSQRDESFLLDILEDCQALIAKKTPAILH